MRRYWEAKDFLRDANWSSGDPVRWVGADSADREHEDLKERPQLYNLDCVAYESLLLGLFTIYRGQPTDRAKPNYVCLGFIRDGFHWSRQERRAFLSVSETYGTWNFGNVQSAGGGCLVVGDKLYFYVSGRAGIPGSSDSGVCTTALAFLRRDGFASMDAGEEGGTLTTRTLRFRGRYLFVNLKADRGELRVEVLDPEGGVIALFSRSSCVPVRGDTTLERIRWKKAPDLASLSGRPVKFRFYLKNGRLYSLWVGQKESGASGGYIAAGGPGFTGPTDTVGLAAYRR